MLMASISLLGCGDQLANTFTYCTDQFLEIDDTNFTHPLHNLCCQIPLTQIY